jgi:hypothetical protein
VVGVLVGDVVGVVAGVVAGVVDVAPFELDGAVTGTAV